MAIADVSAPNVQNPLSGVTGGAFDTQGRFSFGGINTGAGGSAASSAAGASTSAGTDTQSYVAMALIALAVTGIALLLFRR